MDQGETDEFLANSIGKSGIKQAAIFNKMAPSIKGSFGGIPTLCISESEPGSL